MLASGEITSTSRAMTSFLVRQAHDGLSSRARLLRVELGQDIFKTSSGTSTGRAPNSAMDGSVLLIGPPYAGDWAGAAWSCSWVCQYVRCSHWLSLAPSRPPATIALMRRHQLAMSLP